MARLPDETAFGGTPSFGAPRQVASADLGGIARGVEALGQGITKAATAFAAEDDTMSYMQAKADFLPRHIALQDGFKNDNDYGTYEQRYQTESVKARDEAAARIRNPVLRQRFLTETADDLARGHVRIRGLAQAKEADAGIADLGTKLNKLKETIFLAPDEETKTKLIESAGGLIDSAQQRGWWTAQTAAEQKRAWTESYARDWLKTLPPAEQVAALKGPAQGVDAIVDRIIGVESGGNPAARASTSSATGLGQFTRGTWLATVRKHRPDLYNSMSPDELLKLRTDPVLSREMTTRLTEDNIQFLGARGIGATPANVYLAHFLGQGDAPKVLTADPNTPVSQLVKSESIAANRTILEGKTAGQVVAWAERKMGGAPVSVGERRGTSGPARVLDFIPAQEKAELLKQAEKAAAQQFIQNSAARSEQYERSIIDGSAGISPLPRRDDIANDPLIDDARKNALLRQLDAASKDVLALQAGLNKFADPASRFNPYDKADKDVADKIYNHFKGDNPVKALQAVVDRTGIMPASAAKDIRGALVSGDTARVGGALQVVSNIMARNPNAFVGVEGKEELESAAVAFQHQIDHFGRSAEEAAQRFIREQDPQYQREVRSRLKTEDADAILKKEEQSGVLDRELEAAFTDRWQSWFGRPGVGHTVGSRALMRDDYKTLVKEKYVNSDGDMTLAKKLARQQLDNLWGITSINGSRTIVRFPVEKAPAFAGIDNVSSHLAEQAIEEIKKQTGTAPDRGSLIFEPISKGITSQAYMAGRNPPYIISWTDKNGNRQTLNPGKAFMADIDRMRTAVSEQRRQEFERKQAGAMAVEGTLQSTMAGTESTIPVPAEGAFAGRIPEPARQETEEERAALNAGQRRTIEGNLSAMQEAAERQGNLSLMPKDVGRAGSFTGGSSRPRTAR